jgi:NitT/TauT family transport system permease protein
MTVHAESIAGGGRVMMAPGLARRALSGRALPVAIICVAIVVIWYVAAVLLNAPFQRDLDQRRDVRRTPTGFISATLNQPKPAARPHQVAIDT